MSHILDRQPDVFSKTIVSNLCNSKKEKLALECVYFPPVGQGKLCVVGGERGQGVGGKGFSIRPREGGRGKPEGRKRGGVKGKREGEGLAYKLTGGHKGERKIGV